MDHGDDFLKIPANSYDIVEHLLDAQVEAGCPNETFLEHAEDELTRSGVEAVGPTDDHTEALLIGSLDRGLGCMIAGAVEQDDGVLHLAAILHLVLSA